MSTTTQVDAAELLNLLESSEIRVVQEIEDLIINNLRDSKEAWLLNGLIDSYMVSNSKQCMEILAKVREPHDKQLLDRLVDHMKSQKKLQALTLIGHIVSRTPPWLHLIVRHGLMTQLVKCLKTETDIPILMSALLVITTILPMVPVSIASHLPDIFDVFSRLAAFNYKKPGNVPDIYILHLQVGVYSLFHRLYGMYPCHFLTYLRQVYCKKENSGVFEDAIKPMLEKVRMHPLLVTSSKDREIGTERWRQKEVHDIMVECANLSLDITEGVGERSVCPVIAPHRKIFMGTHYSKQHAKQVESLNEVYQSPTIAHHVLDPSTSVPSVLVNSNDSSLFWSPAAVCGLSTPPPVPHTSSLTVSTTDTSLQPASLQGTIPPNTPCRTTPFTSMMESPQPVNLEDSTEKVITGQNSQKRLSGISMSLSGKMSTPVDTQVFEFTPTGGSVPPSPLKPDFTTEPPLTAQTLHAIRKISFSEPPGQQQGPHLVLKKPEKKRLSIKKNPDTEKCHAVESGQQSGGESTCGSTAGVHSVAMLPQLIDSLDSNARDMTDKSDDVDKEVSEIIQGDDSQSEEEGYPSHLPSKECATAESVAIFMKKVNRIRFNSMTVPKKEKNTKHFRSRSCPDLDDKISESGDHSTESKESLTEEQEEPENQNSVVNVTVETTVTTVTTETKATTTVSICEENNEVPEEKAESPLFPYQDLLLGVLPFAGACHCPGCNCSSQKKKELVDSEDGQEKKKSPAPQSGTERPLFTNFSPSDLLDRHIEYGGETHAKQLSNKIPITSHDAVSWTHFGGMPPADEVEIHRGQILLLHNQLMFERHKRELHAKRNRRLLSRVVKTAVLEEQNAAMQDQLRFQEDEIQNLSVSLKLQQKQFHDLKSAKETLEYQMEAQKKGFMVELDHLKNERINTEHELQAEKQRNEDFIRELQVEKFQVFSKDQELSTISKQAAKANDLKGQVMRLNKELVLMGELQQRYQQRLLAVTKSHNSKPESQFILESRKAELASNKINLEQTSTQLDAAQARLLEAEDSLKIKEQIEIELRSTLENAKSIFKGKTEALERKYNTQKKIQQSLQEEILSKDTKIELLEFEVKERKRNIVKPKPQGPSSDFDQASHARRCSSVCLLDKTASQPSLSTEGASSLPSNPRSQSSTNVPFHPIETVQQSEAVAKGIHEANNGNEIAEEAKE